MTHLEWTCLRMRVHMCAGKMRLIRVYKSLTRCYCVAVVEPGRPAWREIVRHFGEGILLENGSIDREQLGSIVFNDNSQRKVLNRCTHPYIRREVLWDLAKHFLKGITSI